MLKHSFKIIILLLMHQLSSTAQNAKEDILRINDAYSKFTDMSMDVTYNVFLNYTASSPYETETGFYKQHENLRFSKLKEIESLQNNNYLIVTDNDQKRIIVGNPVKFNPAKITMLNLDTALSTCSAVEYIGKGAEQGGYRMVFKSSIISQFDKIELYFNKRTYVVEKMVFFYRQKIKLNEGTDAIDDRPRLEIKFSKFNFDKAADLSFFSEKKYIEKNAGKFIASTSYSNYQIVDQKFLK